MGECASGAGHAVCRWYLPSTARVAASPRHMPQLRCSRESLHTAKVAAPHHHAGAAGRVAHRLTMTSKKVISPASEPQIQDSF